MQFQIYNSVQKNEKNTRTVPILKSNSTYFFSTMDIKTFPKGGQGGWPGAG